MRIKMTAVKRKRVRDMGLRFLDASSSKVSRACVMMAFRAQK
jgi:hypothetical protein